MTDTGVPNGDMPNIPHSPLQDGPAVTDADLAALLAGKEDVAPGLRPAADVLAALSAEPGPGELAGEARALAEFRRRAGAPAPRHRAHGTAGLSSRLSAKVAASAAAGAVVLGGAATAAYAGVLPAPIQRFAHDAIGAPNAPSAPHSPAPGKTVAPSGQLAPHGQPAASAKPHSPGRHSSRHGQGQQGTGQGQPGTGQGQPGTGQGQQGNGQGSPPGQGQPGDGQGQGQQGNGQGSPPGRGQPGDGQGRPGNGQGNPHAEGEHGNPHPRWQQGNPHPHAEQVPYRARHARPARHAPAMDT